MRATSIIDSSLKSKNSYIVLHYGEESLILGLNHIHRFSSIQSIAAKEWKIPKDCVVIETNELDICRGQFARIHEDSWDDIKDIVGNVRIRSKEPEGRVVNLNASTPRNSRYTVRPDTEIDEEDEVEHQTRSDSDSARYVVVPESKASDPHTTPLTTFSRESSATVVAAELTDERELDPLHLFSDELDNESETQIEDDATITESELDTAIPSDEAAQQCHAEDRDLEQDDRSPTSRAANSLQEADQSTASVSAPGRVLIAIEAPYLDLEPISFSVRCKHTVSAVLRGACKKHFRIDYHRATLQMVVKDNKGKTCYIPCDDHATMESLEVVDNQTFVLIMREEDEEDEESE